ncbi:FliI/YscN family ATPase [Sphingomonas sp.]|uniref:FliI/YscN family ATPase n=1 Tax=Sphingomonas sp. TaxID=28214 RepID=UPI0025D45785|nr:FliI/YscN family ATPase [Sphingomonas sp.]
MLTQDQLLERLDTVELAPAQGRVISIASHMVEADGPAGTIGQLCEILGEGPPTLSEIIAVEPGRLLLSPFGPVEGISVGSRVVATGKGATAPAGGDFAGRAIDALGRPIDQLGPLLGARPWPIHGDLPPPLDREAPTQPLLTGIRSIDALLSLGRGQRIGIFAASGVGKTSLIEQIAFQTEADQVICCLVGERGREVESLWRSIQKREDKQRFTIVAATSDESAPSRARAPLQALALAEYWRAQGRHVLIIIDSVTRLAMAQREIGLAAGAPPTLRAYTPNVFAALPRLVERCGAVRGGGAISAVMTVLSETDEVDDPIVEVMKSLLDGHIILSRSLAEQSLFPAIDVVKSVSRGLERRTPTSHRKLIAEAIRLMSAWNEARVLIESGAYKNGSDPLIDRAIARREPLRQFLAQPQDEYCPTEQGVKQLADALGEARHG